MGSRIRDNPERLFECFLEVVAPTETVKEPWILQQFPSNFNNKEILQSVGRFAYPCDVESSSTVQHFSYVLTNIDGKWTFGFCRHAPSGLTCICMLSFIPWHETFYKLLDRIAEITHHRAESELEGFLEALYKSKIPVPGSRLRVAYDFGSKTFEVNCPDHLKLPSLPENRNLFEYYSAVDVNNIVIIFASMLNERRVLITSSRLSRLSACIQAASALLYPMHWQHIFIPVLPIQLIDYLSAPMPFLIGVPLPVFARARRSEMGDVVILHADKNRVESPFDDLQSLPLDIATTLRRRLKNPDTMRGDGVARVFLNALVQLIGGYRDALRFKEGEKITFCSQTFIQSRPAHMQPYLERMLHLQIFQQFIEERLDILNSRKGFSDIFEEEVNFYADKGGAKFKTQYKEWMGNFRKEGGALLRTMKDRSKKAYKEMRSMFQETPSKELKYSPSSSMEGMPQQRSAPASPTLVRPVTVHGTKLSRSSSQQKSVISYVRQKDGAGAVLNNNNVTNQRRTAVNGNYEAPKTSVQYSPLEVGESPTETQSIVESDEQSNSPDLSMRRISMDLMGDLQDIIFRKCSLTDSGDLRDSTSQSPPVVKVVTVLAPPVDRSLKPQLSPPISSVSPTEVKSQTISHPLPPPRTKRHHTLKPDSSPKMEDTPLIRLDSDDSDVVFDPLLDGCTASTESANLHYSSTPFEDRLTAGQHSQPIEFVVGAGSAAPLSGAHHVTAVAALNNPVYYQVRPVNPFNPSSTAVGATKNRMSVNGNTFYLHGRIPDPSLSIRPPTDFRSGTASPDSSYQQQQQSDNIDVRNYFSPKSTSPNSFLNNNHHSQRDASSMINSLPAPSGTSPLLFTPDHFRLAPSRVPSSQNATLPPSFPSATASSQPPPASFLHSSSHPRLPMSSSGGVSVSQRVKLYEDTSTPSPPHPWTQKPVADHQLQGGQHQQHHHNRSQTLPEQRKQWQTFE